MMWSCLIDNEAITGSVHLCIRAGVAFSAHYVSGYLFDCFAIGLKHRDKRPVEVTPPLVEWV